MTDRLYVLPDEPGSGALPAGAALAASLTPQGGYSPSWSSERAERVCVALFSVLTQSQQERVLHALGWQLVPLPTVPPKLPAP